jgi:hypothetical protein
MSGVPTSQEEVDVEQVTQQIVDAIERPRQGDMRERGGDGYVDPYSLPGFGESYDDCLDPEMHFCPDCGGTTPKGRNCTRSECPDCAPLWCVDRAEPKLARWQATGKLMNAKLGVPVLGHHVTLIPPEDWYLAAADPLQRTFEVVYDILDAWNAEGIVAYHGWSGEDGDDRGEWKRRLFSGRDWRDVRGELKPRPHFHGIVKSPWIAGGEVTRRVEEETGWVLERIRGLESIEDGAESLVYNLSHTSLEMNDEGNNRAFVRGYGSTYNDVNVYSSTERAASRAVRSVAPRLLGIDPSRLRCEQPVAASEASEYQIDHRSAYADSGTSGTGSETTAGDSAAADADADADRSTHPESDGRDKTICKGGLEHIAEAGEFLEDEEWVEEARYAEQLRRHYQEFIAAVNRDRPPPVAQAFES